MVPSSKALSCPSSWDGELWAQTSVLWEGKLMVQWVSAQLVGPAPPLMHI